MRTNSRTISLFRSLGYFVESTEKWNPHVRRRQDLFGWMDAMGFNGSETLGLQSCGGSDVQPHIAKILSLPAAIEWMETPGRKAIVVAWRKRVRVLKDGSKGKAPLWMARVITLDIFGQQSEVEIRMPKKAPRG